MKQDGEYEQTLNLLVRRIAKLGGREPEQEITIEAFVWCIMLSKQKINKNVTSCWLFYLQLEWTRL